KALISTGLFQDVRPTIQGGRLTITVVENPVINRIAFEGNKKVKDDQLKSEIQSKERGTLSRPVVQADTARIVELYRRSGRFDVRVDPKIIEPPSNRVDLVFETTEGVKTGVKSIEFIGNRAYSSSRLRKRSRHPKPDHFSHFCRRAISTIRTGSKRIASCCADFISSTATSTCASSPRSENTIRIEEGSSSPSPSRRVSSTATERATFSRPSGRSIRLFSGGSCGLIPATSTMPKRSRRPSRT